MSQLCLLAWIAFVCFGYGLFVGRLLEQRRHGTLAFGDWECLQLSAGLVVLAFIVEQAGRAGWLRYTATVSNSVGFGYLIAGGLMLFFIARMLRHTRSGVA